MRITGLEARKDLGGDQSTQQIGNSQNQLSALCLVQFGELVVQIPHDLFDLDSGFDKGLALRSQLQTVLYFCEENDAGFLLDFLERLAEGRLGNIEFLGGFCDSPFLSDGDNIIDFTKVKIHVVPLSDVIETMDSERNLLEAEIFEHIKF